ncbi:MAG: matrixin family metalloprotease [Candidatus Competibacter sp.]|nr:matrixin family metalloprotease [Candidatus Competibacter sp.]HRD48906.1 matrixin family metalloprotease [Candidatus Contendobacter sp.]
MNPSFAIAGIEKLIRTIVLTMCFALWCDPAAAFLTFDGNSKWGSPTLGTGATITWSLIPDGTGVVQPSPPPFIPPAFIFSDFWSGTSDLASVYAQLNPADPVNGQSLFNTAINNAFATWAADANITFVQVSDDGSPLGHTGPTAGKVGDIRIGAFGLLSPFDAVAAQAFEPPGGTSALAAYLASTDQPSTFGDITLNKFALFGVAQGNEGDAFDFSNGFFNDIQGLLTHEIGHALGLGHPEADGLTGDEGTAIMYVGTGCCDNIHRTLGVDDIAGIQYLYGAPVSTAIPVPATLPLFLLGLVGMRVVVRRRRV